MRIHKVQLHNIRSYVSQEICFPEGSCLLWGNIGSGKSSILLAIDFALFGLQRENLSGASLLRNGTELGSVTLHFSLDGKEVILHRALKRTKTGVTQDAGYLIRDGVKEDKTAVELKQEVLSLLHYPAELLTKNKSLIYRYTVYTPQEEMKQILLGKSDDRLDTLRRVFGIDKYKRIQDNAKLVVTHIRSKKRMYDGAVADLPEKQAECQRCVEERSGIQSNVLLLRPQLDLCLQQLQEKKSALQEVEAQKVALLEAKQELAACQSSLQHQLATKRRDEEALVLLQEEIGLLSGEDLSLVEDLLEKVKDIDAKIRGKEQEVRELLNNVQDCRTRSQHAGLIKQKIESLSNCPTCLQEVSLTYKEGVVQRTVQEMHAFEQQILEQTQKKQICEQVMHALKEEVQLLRKREAEQKLIQLKRRQLEEKWHSFNELQARLGQVKQELGATNTKIMLLQERLAAFSAVEARLPQLQQEVEAADLAHRKVEREHLQLEAQLLPLQARIHSLQTEIQRKNALLKKKEQLNTMQFWLTDTFIPMVETMEKNIMLKVHEDFSALFERWFTILIDNQLLQMTLDEEYAPKILQDGYDIDFNYLSGGEKTAGALAYRLALNQIINQINAGIKTKDLLILDEPTDGFSHEQLDRLRVLMDELQIPQIIMVSHEPQIESFVDTTIKFEKREHVTHIV